MIVDTPMARDIVTQLIIVTVYILIESQLDFRKPRNRLEILNSRAKGTVRGRCEAPLSARPQGRPIIIRRKIDCYFIQTHK